MDEQQTPQKLHPTNNQKTVKKKSIPIFSITLITLIIIIGVVYFLVLREKTDTTEVKSSVNQNTAASTITNTTNVDNTNTTSANTSNVNRLPAEIDTTDLDAALKAVDTATNKADTSFNEFESINADDDAAFDL